MVIAFPEDLSAAFQVVFFLGQAALDAVAKASSAVWMESAWPVNVLTLTISIVAYAPEARVSASSPVHAARPWVNFAASIIDAHFPVMLMCHVFAPFFLSVLAVPWASVTSTAARVSRTIKDTKRFRLLLNFLKDTKLRVLFHYFSDHTFSVLFIIY